MERYIHQGPPAKVRASLKKHLPSVGASRLLAAAAKREVKVNGRRVREGELISPGDRVEVFLPEPPAFRPEAVFDSGRVLAVNKPRGIPTVGGHSLESELQRERGESWRAVHRLDTNTAGLVLFAGDEGAAGELLAAFREGRVRKFYSAVLCRPFEQREGLWSDFLFKDAKKSRVYVRAEDGKGYLPIATAYRILREKGDLAWAELELHTGRTHQIRAQSAFHGHPVLGDGKYGDPGFNRRYGRKDQCLCARKLLLRFPSGELKDLDGLTLEIGDPFAELFDRS